MVLPPSAYPPKRRKLRLPNGDTLVPVVFFASADLLARAKAAAAADLPFGEWVTAAITRAASSPTAVHSPPSNKPPMTPCALALAS
jgi:hypothetical protein